MTTEETPCLLCDKPCKHPHCYACERKLLADGICKWCGNAPRKPKHKCASKQSDYCPACQAKVVLNNLHSAEERKPRYRDSGARENTWETKNL